MLKSFSRRTAAVAALTIAAVSAQASVSYTYDVTGVQASGMGGWNYTFSAGNGTLNDGFIPVDHNNNELFLFSDSPTVTLNFSAPVNVGTITIFGGYTPGNSIPGTLTGWTTTIGSSSFSASSTEFGAGCVSGLCNDSISLVGTGLDAISTSSVTLSNFTGGWSGYFNIGEVVVEGTSAPVAEPASLALFGLGLLGLAFARRRQA